MPTSSAHSFAAVTCSIEIWWLGLDEANASHSRLLARGRGRERHPESGGTSRRVTRRPFAEVREDRQHGVQRSQSNETANPG
ncbi:MAG: hypothetical protein ABI251_03080 [Mycobacteriaceae bacterium]